LSRQLGTVMRSLNSRRRIVERAEDSKSMTDKEGALAHLETGLARQKSGKAQSEKDLGTSSTLCTLSVIG